jgi:hypothetical protein
MSKRNRRRQTAKDLNSATGGGRSWVARKLIVIACAALLAVSSVTAGVILATRQSKAPTSTTVAVSHESPQTATQLSKEYIYVGNKLAAVDYRPSSGNGAPGSPAGLAAVLGLGGSLIDLNWSPTGSNQSGFKIERSVGTDTAFTLLGTVDPTATHFLDNQVTPPNTYFYRVKAFNTTGGDSAPSNEASATVPTGIPNAPTNMVTTAVSTSQLNIGWTVNSTNETGFKLERAAGLMRRVRQLFRHVGFSQYRLPVSRQGLQRAGGFSIRNRQLHYDTREPPARPDESAHVREDQHLSHVNVE